MSLFASRRSCTPIPAVPLKSACNPVMPTVSGLLVAPEVQSPGISVRAPDDSGALRRLVNVYVEDDSVRFTEGLDTAVVAGAQVSIIPAGAVDCGRQPSSACRWYAGGTSAE
jgi:molybdopterin synthase sulfur carrier subunit